MTCLLVRSSCVYLRIAGLESLFISEIGPADTLGLWSLALRHRESLRRFAYQQRSIDVDETSQFFEEEHDLSDLVIIDHAQHKLRMKPAESPLAQFDLDFIALTCRPEILVRLGGLRVGIFY